MKPGGQDAGNRSASRSSPRLPVPVVTERVDGGPPAFEMVVRTVEVAELAIGVAQVEMQGRIETPHGAGDTRLPRPLIGDQVGRLQGAQVPAQLLAHVVLDVGHRVRQRTAVQRVAGRTDLLPQSGEQPPRGLPVAAATQFDALADPGHRRVGLGHPVSSSGGDGAPATVAAGTDTSPTQLTVGVLDPGPEVRRSEWRASCFPPDREPDRGLRETAG
ncbi:hypothetical protein FHR32_002143 [Streptosporangium album]|uniref:Uncharacterized protein n=1 Tax=Streptosporangium album TaxID=47479 RepID=A0A7W7RUL0_9ACTN|nr:hypothetical protein [Streptosporangium album]